MEIEILAKHSGRVADLFGDVCFERDESRLSPG